jgi:RNA polymerase sigma factor (sigma-70 family)
LSALRPPGTRPRAEGEFCAWCNMRGADGPPFLQCAFRIPPARAEGDRTGIGIRGHLRPSLPPAGWALGVDSPTGRGASATDAEDVVMDAFVVCIRRRKDVPTEPLPWLLGVARRALADRRRSQQRFQSVVEKIKTRFNEVQSQHDEPLSTEGSEILTKISRLPAKDLEVLLLVSWDGLTSAEAAIVLGCSAQAV